MAKYKSLFRFRRGTISVGQSACDGCDRVIHHGEVYLSIDEKPSGKLDEDTKSFKNEELQFVEEITCSECGNEIEGNKPVESKEIVDKYLFVLDGDSEKVYCPACYKKKGGEAFRKKNAGVLLDWTKSKVDCNELHFCRDCCEKRKAGMEKKEKGEKLFSFFTAKALK